MGFEHKLAGLGNDAFPLEACLESGRMADKRWWGTSSFGGYQGHFQVRTSGFGAVRPCLWKRVLEVAVGILAPLL